MIKYLSCIVLLTTFLCNVCAEPSSFSLESYDMPGWYVGAENEDVHLIRLETEIDRENTTFSMVPGLANEAYVSIRSTADTNYYLIFQNEDIKLQEESRWIIYKMNATFKWDKGLVNTNNKDLVSFRSWKYHDLLIRHKGSKIQIDEFDGSDHFKRNATFIVKPPNWDGKNRLSAKRMGEKSFSGSGTASCVLFVMYSTLIIITLIFIVINSRKKRNFRNIGKGRIR